MKPPRRQFLHLAAGVAALPAVSYVMRSIRYPIIAAFLAMAAVPAAAQTNYPNRSVRLIFGFPPGGDVVARLFADRLAKAFGKPVIVDNVTGAAGNIAADRTAKAAADGYTIGMLSAASIVANVSLYKRLSYDPARDLAPISQIYGFSFLLVVNNDVPAKSVAELVALARARPGTLSFGHSGVGGAGHLAGEMLKSMAHIDIQGVPYRGGPPLNTDLLSGQIAMGFVALGAGGTLPLIREGKLRALAVTSRERVPFAPDLPTMGESGFPGFDFRTWFGLFAPARTPASVIETLNRETVKIMALPDVRQKLSDIDYVALSNTPAEFAALIKTEMTYWARVIKDSGIPRIE
jgi:tripartite-type tricarboxylate transporter receptor subunit TctC